MGFLDRHAWDNAWRHRHPGEKMLLAGGMLLLVQILPAWPSTVLVALVATLCAILGARIPLAAWIRGLATPAAFVLSASVAGLLTIQSGADGWSVGVSPTGLSMMSHIVPRAMASLSCLLLLSMTTPVVETLEVMRRCGAPREIIWLASTIYRFLHVGLDAAARMLTAQASRCGYCDARSSRRSAGRLGGLLLWRLLEQARRLQTGLESRNRVGVESMLPLFGKPRPMALARVLLVQAAITGVSLCA